MIKRDGHDWLNKISTRFDAQSFPQRASGSSLKLMQHNGWKPFFN